jgi:hypothetical protein
MDKIDIVNLSREELLDNYLKVEVLKKFLESKIMQEEDFLKHNDERDRGLSNRIQRRDAYNDKRLCECILGMLK